MSTDSAESAPRPLTTYGRYLVLIVAFLGWMFAIRFCREPPISRRARLNWANLQNADLRGADLAAASLVGANLYGADLYGANLT